MKYAALAAIVLAVTLLGSTCVPLFNLDSGNTVVTPSTKLSASVLKPSVTREVPADSVIQIEWTAVNLTGEDAVATVLVRLRADLSDTILAGGLRLPESGGTRTLDWDTSGFQGGEYSIHVQVTAGDQSDEATAPGRITLNTPPSFKFTAPVSDITLGDVVVDPNDPNAFDPNSTETAPIRIKWTAFDPDGDGLARIMVDPDEDHQSGNEIILTESALLKESSSEKFDWNGDDENGARVAADTYFLYADVSDNVNPDQTIESPAKLTIPEEPNAIVLAVTQPAEDTEFLAGDPNMSALTIEYTLDESDDVLIDLDVDVDDNHTNGNETLILSQRLVEKGTNDGSFDWEGDDVAGDPVRDGIYRVLMLVNRGSGAPQIVQSDGLVFRRSEEGQPLIALLEPNTDQTETGGQFLFIKWRDDDPDEVSKVNLYLDDDDQFGEDPEVGEAPRKIMPEPRDASGDGVQDTFNYKVPPLGPGADQLAPGRYYIIATIDRDSADPVDNWSVAGGQLVIDDPNTP